MPTRSRRSRWVFPVLVACLALVVGSSLSCRGGGSSRTSSNWDALVWDQGNWG